MVNILATTLKTLSTATILPSFNDIAKGALQHLSGEQIRELSCLARRELKSKLNEVLAAGLPAELAANRGRSLKRG
jgi:hypothetical protein